jgi:hypothetical protein
MYNQWRNGNNGNETMMAGEETGGENQAYQ